MSAQRLVGLLGSCDGLAWKE